MAVAAGAEEGAAWQGAAVRENFLGEGLAVACSGCAAKSDSMSALVAGPPVQACILSRAVKSSVSHQLILGQEAALSQSDYAK